ncbi:hypothetical protein RB195_001538 [Necator americanus]|uniref:NET domain-containing protein n=1 Tax=Necator americanus TaxID=51031 RepID=A0ABR1DFZ7_NECAM
MSAEDIRDIQLFFTLQSVQLEPLEGEESSSGTYQPSWIGAEETIFDIPSEIPYTKEAESSSLDSGQPVPREAPGSAGIFCIKKEVDDNEFIGAHENGASRQSHVIVKTEPPSLSLAGMYDDEQYTKGSSEISTNIDVVKMECKDFDEVKPHHSSSFSPYNHCSVVDDTITDTNRSPFQNSLPKLESEDIVDEHPPVAESLSSARSGSYKVCGLVKRRAPAQSARGKKGKKRKSKIKQKCSEPKTSSTVLRQSRKRGSPNNNFTTSINIGLLPRRSSNRLKRKQLEQAVDYSQLPPKFTGPLLPSMHFCHYVLEQLMSAKYEPINWLVDLATVKKKLDYRQYEDADEFAAEIRAICMNPLDDSLANNSLSLLDAFEQLWIYMPLDPELPLVPEGAEDMDEMELKYSAMLAVLINNRKKCEFYGNQLSLHVQRLEEMNVVRCSRGQQGNVLSEIPRNLIEEMNALAMKLKPYASIPIDILMEGCLMDSTDCLVLALRTVAPGLVKMFGGKIEEQVIFDTHEGEEESNPNQRHLDSEDEEMMTLEKQQQLANDVEKLSDEGKIIVLGIIACDDKVEVRSDDEEVHVELTNATPDTFRKVAKCVATLTERQLSCPASEEAREGTLKTEKCSKARNSGNKRITTRSKSITDRKQNQLGKKRAVDIEARKRELVEGIKKLGGTGATRPMRKQVPYLESRLRVRTSYVYRSSSSSSDSTATSNSWESDSASSTEYE